MAEVVVAIVVVCGGGTRSSKQHELQYWEQVTGADSQPIRPETMTRVVHKVRMSSGFRMEFIFLCLMFLFAGLARSVNL